MKHNLADMSWQEAGERLKANPVVLVPFGTTEQNGAHNPLGTDAKLALYFARRVAESTDNCYLPVTPFGYSAAFRNFPGTVWLSPETMRAVALDVLSSLLHHGVRRVIIVNNHGPNEPMIEHAVREIQDRYPDVLVPLIWPAKVLRTMLDGIIPKDAKLGHGSEPTTSLMLAIDPNSVSPQRAVADSLEPIGNLKIRNSWTAEHRGIGVGLYTDIDWVSATGTSGSPSGATAERGQEILDRLVSWGVEFLRDFYSEGYDLPRPSRLAR